MKIYKVQRFGELMVTRTYIKGPEAIAYPRLLIDTGWTYTIISPTILTFIGCPPESSTERRLIATGSRYERLAVVQVDQFSCLGESVEGIYVLAHALPFGTYVDGLLGMDFLRQFPIVNSNLIRMKWF